MAAASEEQEGVTTTPQVYIGGERIGGSDALQRYLTDRPWRAHDGF